MSSQLYKPNKASLSHLNGTTIPGWYIRHGELWNPGVCVDLFYLDNVYVVIDPYEKWISEGYNITYHSTGRHAAAAAAGPDGTVILFFTPLFIFPGSSLLNRDECN